MISRSRLCVFCGSASGVKPGYPAMARQLGREMAERGVSLVFGGGGIGLMGILADAVLAAGGEVIGVIPRGLASKEVAHQSLTTLHVVETMHQRKAMMAELSDAFLALPGGFGTFDELFEIITWSQLGIHRKPIGILNADGYFDPLITLIDHAVVEGFASAETRALVEVVNSTTDWFRLLDSWQPPPIPIRWITIEQV